MINRLSFRRRARAGITLPVAVAAVLGVLASPAPAQQVRLEFPLRGDGDVPAGFSAAPDEVRAPVAKIELPLLALTPAASLFATFVFQENDGDAILVTWVPDSGAPPHVLSSNLCEGVKGWNQRTLRIPAEVAGEPGRLVIQENGPLVRKILLRWLSPQAVYVDAPAGQSRLVNVDGGVLSDEQMGGEPVLSPPDAWFGEVVDAYLHSGIEPLTAPLEFAIPGERKPGAAVLIADVLGLPPGGRLPVWVNERFVGWLAPVAPDLRDPGYYRTGDGSLAYAGWRRARLLVDSELLEAGGISVVIDATPGNVFLKGTILQLMFATSTGESPTP